MDQHSHTDPSPGKTDTIETQWLRDVGNVLDTGIIALSRNFDIVFKNDQVAQYLDLPDLRFDTSPSFKAIIRQMAERGDFGDVEPASYTDTYLDKIRAFADGDDSVEFFDTIIPTNGKTIKITRHRSHDGTILATLEDVTEQARTDEVFSIAFALGNSGYWHYNFATNNFTVCSQYLDSLLSSKEKKALQEEGFWAILHPDDLQDCREEWKKILRNKITFDRVVRIKTSENGIRWFKLHARPQETNVDRLTNVICFFEDVTPSLALQDDLRKAKNQAEKTLESQNHFLARLSHEIRTPMNAVIGIADALVQHSENPAITPKLELIQSSADSIMNILEGTLNQSKLDSDKLLLDPKPANPRDTVRSICELWEQQATKNGTTIRYHIDAKVPSEILFDRFRYEQCLNNLLSNAVKFTPNGKVDVVLTLVGDNPKSQKLVLAVRDTGIGMTKKQQSRIFDAYTQADKTISSRFGGTGLGMSITKQIIELMGGTISVKSDMGKGTIFALSLPLEIEEEIIEENESADDALMSHIMEEAKPEETPYSNLKILVADDNATNHMVIESLLDSVVGQIYRANNGSEVLDILQVEDIDIVLMDIHMPVMDGIEATLAIRSSEKHWSDVLIIAVTADPQYQQVRLCKNIGMDDSLAKPIKLSGILEAFDTVLAIDRDEAPYKEVYKKVV